MNERLTDSLPLLKHGDLVRFGDGIRVVTADGRLVSHSGEMDESQGESVAVAVAPDRYALVKALKEFGPANPGHDWRIVASPEVQFQLTRTVADIFTSLDPFPDDLWINRRVSPTERVVGRIEVPAGEWRIDRFDYEQQDLTLDDTRKLSILVRDLIQTTQDLTERVYALETGEPRRPIL